MAANQSAPESIAENQCGRRRSPCSARTRSGVPKTTPCAATAESDHTAVECRHPTGERGLPRSECRLADRFLKQALRHRGDGSGGDHGLAFRTSGSGPGARLEHPQIGPHPVLVPAIGKREGFKSLTGQATEFDSPRRLVGRGQQALEEIAVEAGGWCRSHGNGAHGSGTVAGITRPTPPSAIQSAGSSPPRTPSGVL